VDMLTPVTAEELSHISIFSGLTEADREAIAERSLKVYVREGIHLLQKGESGFEFFVVLEGSADVMVDGNTVATIGPGGVFGEMALLGGGRRTADVLATSHMIVATMMVWDFRQMLKDLPEVGDRLNELAKARSQA
jgi:CRP-like cAMP-binding protein